jgi:arylsulfatase A-like enzyme
MIHFRSVLGLVPLLMWLPVWASDGEPPPAARPNMILILTDDMRWDVMGCAGHPLLKTPEIDRLATNGTRFTDAFVTTSICNVSRASILTGQYARRHGVWDFQTPVDTLSSAYPGILRQRGYHTGFIGKWGVGAHGSPQEYFQRCAASFDFWAGDVGQTCYWHERTCNYITNNGTTERTRCSCSCGEGRKNDGCGPSGPNPALKDPVHAETEFVPAKIRSFLAQRDTSKPFCLSLSLKAPHDPWQGHAPRFENHFQGVDIPRRGNVTREEALRQPGFLRSSLESGRGLELIENSAEHNRLLGQYYRLIEGIDHCVGEIRRELERSGLLENTVIVFTSDNGRLVGEHGFWGKWLIHEESIRVPLIICDPRLPAAMRGRVSTALALNIDLAPTLLELAGVRVPDSMQGRSLLPLLRDPGAPWRDDFFYEHLYRNSPDPPARIEPCEGVRTRDWKYIVWVDQTGAAREELYDLRKDPLEMRNLAADPSARGRLGDLRRRHTNFSMELK